LLETLFGAHTAASTAHQPLMLFLSGDRSSVGKSSTCLSLLAALVGLGVDPALLAYIKPVTQCEAEQPVSVYCEAAGIAHVGVGPVVFYKGFTRAYLKGETEPAPVLVASAARAVHALAVGKRFVLVDGVGYPAVGSICNVSNADIARALGAPVLLVGKVRVSPPAPGVSPRPRPPFYPHHPHPPARHTTRSPVSATPWTRTTSTRASSRRTV
jgi:hypothetical protein